MLSTNIKHKAVSAGKVAFRHYAEFLADPVKGVAITQLQSQLFHVSTRVTEGPYEGLTIHWELKIPDYYPFQPPFGEVVANYDFDERFHHHVFRSAGICADFLSNFEYMHQSAGVGQGWTSSCNFISLMIAMQAFFADPDGAHPSREDIANLRFMDKRFTCSPCAQANADANSGATLTDVAESPAMQRARKEMFCSVTKANFIDDKDVSLGYPLSVTKDRFGRLHTTLFPELLSFDAYMTEYQLRYGEGMRTSSGHFYTNWLPIYLDEARFEKYHPVMTTTISVIANGPQGSSRNDFHPMNIIKVLPALLNQQIVALMKGEAHESESAINAFVSLLRLFKRLLELYPQLLTVMKREAEAFRRDENSRHKRRAGDLGEFLMKLAVLKEHYPKLSFDDPHMRRAVMGESFARQILWMQKADPTLPKHICSTYAREEDLVRLLRRTFAASDVSNRLTVYNIEALRMFAFPEFEEHLDKNYGIAPEWVILRFQARIKLIKRKMNSYRVMMQAINFTDTVRTPQAMQLLLKRAVECSYRAGYHR
ncbi:hypothetical protein M427DRAFT_34461 [Gonapodya prolifera JEL478]|uniref:UBC core domain-containing protein n=1 Tax=Gonapodya prolifera (strain JEL478) TaxID=1344416 RepID=A0A139A816_GONPJ|nr:hypothetical protein M427DRAFT_34461 [Gonapodya prolifera JEL478]|eukprot:KXS12839.1 hypothetical protein M427DRAFT_34461 [Gonapodya prolifera JEL478]